jgi:hypothetical protein
MVIAKTMAICCGAASELSNHKDTTAKKKQRKNETKWRD